MKRHSLDVPAIKRIVAAVGDKYVPAELDREKLHFAIEEAFATAKMIERYRPPHVNKHLKQMAQISKAADRLLSLLEVHNDALGWLTKSATEATLGVMRLRAEIKIIEEMLLDSVRTLAIKYPSRVPSSTEWLFGVELPCIYEEFFGRPVKQSRNKQGLAGKSKPAGPLVRFLKAIADETQNVEVETIARAVTRLSETRARRRRVRKRDIGQE